MSATPVSVGDPSAERGVLSGIFQHGADAYFDVADIVTSQTFTIDSNQILWNCIDKTFKEDSNATVDIPTILSAAASLGYANILSKPEERAHLRAITNMPIMVANVRKMAGKIRKLEIARLLSSQLKHAQTNLGNVTGDESVDAIVGLAEGPIFDLSSLLTNAGDRGVVRMGDNMQENLQFLMDNPREMMGISTGMKRYDMAIGGGVRRGSLDIIAARAKAGKSMIVDNVAAYIAGTLGVPVLNVDTEMTAEEHQIRIAANLAGVKSYDIETGKVGTRPQDAKRVLEAAKRVQDMPYYYNCIIGKNFEDALSEMRRWVTKEVGLDENGKANPCVIIYDYLKMLSADFTSGNMSEHQALGYLTSSLKNFMGRYGVGCLCFAQLNRDGLDVENEAAIAGSDRIVHYCTSMSIYKWKTDEERAEAVGDSMKYTHKLIPVVSRHGQGLRNGEYINIETQYSMSRLIEGPTNYELNNSSSQRTLSGGVSDIPDVEVDADGFQL